MYYRTILYFIVGVRRMNQMKYCSCGLTLSFILARLFVKIEETLVEYGGFYSKHNMIKILLLPNNALLGNEYITIL